MKVKYKKTFHVEWSPGLQNDDRVQKDLSNFKNKRLIVSEKMDGEGTTMSSEYIHARSVDSIDHPSRHWVKGLWGRIKHEIPKNWRICVENVYATHSLKYRKSNGNALDSYCFVFIWNDKNMCLSYDETLEYCYLLGLLHAPILYDGVADLESLKAIKIDTEKQEGYVIRLADSFHYDDFQTSVVKWVRGGHVQTDEHWLTKPIIPNELKIDGLI